MLPKVHLDFALKGSKIPSMPISQSVSVLFDILHVVQGNVIHMLLILGKIRF